jgi:DNA-binding MarR family transcriptional regulator
MMYVSPEAHALLIQVSFNLVNERAVRVSVGDEERAYLNGLMCAQIVNPIKDVGYFFVA